MNKNLQSGYGATITVPFILQAQNNAGGGDTQVIPVLADYFYLTSLSGANPIEVQPNNDGANPFIAGQGNHPPAGNFSQVTLRNTNPYIVTGTIVIGTDGQTGFVDKRIILIAGAQGAPLYVEPTPTFPLGSGVSTMAAGATLTFTGLGQTGPRQQIVFDNLDPNVNLQVLDGAGNLFYTIPPNQSWTWQSQGTFKLFNPNGSGVAMSAGETYYVQ